MLFCHNICASQQYLTKSDKEATLFNVVASDVCDFTEQIHQLLFKQY